MAATHPDPIEAYAAKISDQVHQAAKQPVSESNEWKAGYAAGAKIARNIAKERGYTVPAETQ